MVGQVIGEGEGLRLRYDAFGDIGTICRELAWKHTNLFLKRGPEHSKRIIAQRPWLSGDDGSSDFSDGDSSRGW